jgi:hypothetical protein
MKTKLFFVMVMFVAMISVASAEQNSIVDNIKLALGMDHNEFNVTNNTGHLKFGDMLKIQAKYDTDVEWYIDGQLVRKAKAVRTSWINPDLKMLPKQDPKNKVGYKAGRDPLTKKMRHLVELKYSEGKARWVISE